MSAKRKAKAASESTEASTVLERVVIHNGGTLRPWVKGQSGNPGGRGGKGLEVLRMARERSPEVMAMLITIALDEKGDNRERIVAAKEVLAACQFPQQVPDDHPRPDLSKLTPAQLKKAREVFQMLMKTATIEGEQDGKG